MSKGVDKCRIVLNRVGLVWTMLNSVGLCACGWGAGGLTGRTEAAERAQGEARPRFWCWRSHCTQEPKTRKKKKRMGGSVGPHREGGRARETSDNGQGFLSPPCMEVYSSILYGTAVSRQAVYLWCSCVQCSGLRTEELYPDEFVLTVVGTALLYAIHDTVHNCIVRELQQTCLHLQFLQSC